MVRLSLSGTVSPWKMPLFILAFPNNCPGKFNYYNVVLLLILIVMIIFYCCYYYYYYYYYCVVVIVFANGEGFYLEKQTASQLSENKFIISCFC